MRTASPDLLTHLSRESALERFSGPALAAGRAAVVAGRVSRPALATRRAMAVVGEGRRSARTALRLTRDAVTADCSCGAAWCEHAAALALLLRGDALDEGQAGEEPAAAPSPRDAERQRRVARGASELFEIRRRSGGGQGLLGEYEVASPSSRAYAVTVRALDAPHNGCTCPDFATNLLGTCKHIEAVIHHLRTDAPRRFRRATSHAPSAGYLHLVLEPDMSVGFRCSTERSAAARGDLPGRRPQGGGLLGVGADAGRGRRGLQAGRRRVRAAPRRRALRRSREADRSVQGGPGLPGACRALDPQGDPGAEPAQLLAAIHARMLPQRLLTEGHAAALSRADEAARAFAASPVAPPEPLISRIAAEAAGLVGRVAGSR